jgi:beta-glucosidase
VFNKKIINFPGLIEITVRMFKKESKINSKSHLGYTGVQKSYSIRKLFLAVFFINLQISFLIGQDISGYDRSSNGFNIKYEPVIDSIIKLMTLDEKIAMLHGDGTFVSKGIERLGIPELNYTDGPNGIREDLERTTWKPLKLTTDSATFFPTGTALAATWNRKLAVEYGKAIGMEARARKKDVLLGPGVNIIRTPLCGRNFEYFTEDPFLNGEIAAGYVNGVQSENVAACVKHFALNNQETERGKISVNVSERALREIYLPVYKSCIDEAGAYSMMGAYNKFRGTYLCENDYLINKVLKQEFGFKGIVVSDWNATHSTTESALAGLDVEMGTKASDYNQYYMAYPLRDSVLSNVVPVEIIDDKVRRILRVIYNCKMLEPDRKSGALVTPEIISAAYNVAAEAIVLLKNDKNILPLKSHEIKSIAVIGQNAKQIQSFGGATAGVKAKYEITPYEALISKYGNNLEIGFAQGYIPKFVEEENKWMKYPDNNADTTLIAEAVELAKTSDIAIIFVGNTRDVETETRDRKDIRLPFGQDALIKAVTSANPKTIVVVVAGAACDLNATNENANAILYSWFNGSEAGNAITDVIFGKVNPSGKLPFTIPVKLEDIGVHTLGAYPGENLEVEYKEDILVGYRWFDTKNIESLFPFGYGLSYSTFKYKSLTLNKKTYSRNDELIISVKIENIGQVTGKEVVQCYTKSLKSSVLRADKELKAFDKVEVLPGETKTVTFKINVSELAYFSETDNSWVIEPGDYKVCIGSSSRQINLESIFKVK